MDYSQTLDWMFGRLPMYQRQGASAYRKDLTNIKLLCNHLGNPQTELRCIHVAGTNGKGSTCHMLASVLQEAGYKTGLFTSPHLVDFRERIRIDGMVIPQSYVMDFVGRHRTFFEAHDMSFFEMTTGLAFQFFKDSGTDICIIETGMGGRLDSTNIITPILSIITNIGMDHTQFLGNTPESIAGEKAGIIKPGVPVVIGQSTSSTKAVFETAAADSGSNIIFAEDGDYQTVKTDLLGKYQRHNIKTVHAALGVLKHLDIPPTAVAQGLANVARNTGLRGRWEKICENPLVIADTAHNADGLRETMAQAAEVIHDKMRIVFGAVNDKELDGILRILPKNAIYYFCRPDIPRGLDPHLLLLQARESGLSGVVFNSVREAYVAALGDASADDFIYVGGSNFVVAEIL